MNILITTLFSNFTSDVKVPNTNQRIIEVRNGKSLNANLLPPNGQYSLELIPSEQDCIKKSISVLR